MSVDVTLDSAAQRAGAGLVIGQVGHLLNGGPNVLEDAIRGDGRLETLDGPVSAIAVGTGAAALIARLLGDVETVLGLSYPRTIANLGLWVARQELDHGI